MKRRLTILYEYLLGMGNGHASSPTISHFPPSAFTSMYVHLCAHLETQQLWLQLGCPNFALKNVFFRSET